MRRFKIAVLLLLAAGSHPLFAQGGALPKGNYKAPKKSVKPATAVKTPETTTENCSGRVFEVGEGAGSFAKDGQLLYLLARNKIGGKLPRYTIFRIDPELKKAEPIYALEQKGEVALMPLNNPVKAVSTVSFLGPCAAQFEGAAGSVTVSLEKGKSDKAVQLSGDFALMDTPAGRGIADLKKSAVLEMDGLTFQTKLSARFEKGDRPLFHDSVKRFLVAWHQGDGQRGLVTYYNDSAKPGARLAIAEGDRLIRNGDKFGAYSVLAKSNSVVIHEIPDWSGVKTKKDFTVKVDRDMPVGRATVALNFSARVAAFFIQSWPGRAARNKVYLYSYETGKFIGKIVPADGEVPGYVSFTRDGSWLLVETKNYAGKYSTNVKIMNIATGLIDSVKLNFQK